MNHGEARRLAAACGSPAPRRTGNDGPSGAAGLPEGAAGRLPALRRMKRRIGASVAPRSLPAVSVVIPARNAEASIPATLDSVLSQDYTGPVEVVVADGSDTSATSEIVRRLYPTVRLIPNPDRSAGSGFNRALRVATGEVIARCDAHASFPPGYLRRAVETLQGTGAANVGGRQRPVGTTFFERLVAIAMRTLLGSGGARYRTGGPEGPVDTVYLGVFRRKALEAVGGADPSLLRNQDYELNWRLRAHGDTVWFDPGLEVRYRPRGTLWALARQYFDYGRWKRVVIRRHPHSLRARHLAAPLLVAGLAASALTGSPWAAVLPLSYLLVLVAGSLAAGIRHREPAALLLPPVLATMHLSWGAGFFFPPRTHGRRRREGGVPFVTRGGGT